MMAEKMVEEMVEMMVDSRVALTAQKMVDSRVALTAQKMVEMRDQVLVIVWKSPPHRKQYKRNKHTLLLPKTPLSFFANE
jgi:hypothetical protein